MTHLKSPEVLGTLGKVHRALPMTQGTSSHSTLFCIIMYKYKALPLQIIISLPILMSFSKLRITMFCFASLERYIHELYIFYNLYIEPDHLALSQISSLNIED